MEIDSIDLVLYFQCTTYNRSAVHKYFSRITNNNIQIYYTYNYISLINLYLNYDY
jgi:hypothetical protein